MFSADLYIDLDPKIAQQCELTFRYPKHWKITVSESETLMIYASSLMELKEKEKDHWEFL